MLADFISSSSYRDGPQQAASEKIRFFSDFRDFRVDGLAPAWGEITALTGRRGRWQDV
jgi:hypothetical protein